MPQTGPLVYSLSHRLTSCADMTNQRAELHGMHPYDTGRDSRQHQQPSQRFRIALWPALYRCQNLLNRVEPTN